MKLEDMIRVELRSLRPGSPAAQVGPGSGRPGSESAGPSRIIAARMVMMTTGMPVRHGRYRDRGTVAPGLGRTAIGPRT